MRDLTKDSITVHILTMAAPVAMSMLVHIAYQLINLHFVSKISTEAVAGMNAAANVVFIVAALAQVLGVGTTALVSHKAGIKDFSGMSGLLSQSLVLSAACALGTAIALYLLMPPYLESLFRDDAVIEAGVRFVLWVTPGYALLFPMMVMSATLRGAGVVRIPAMIFTLTVIVDAALASVLIPGWGVFPRLGVDGAGLATTLSIVVGLALMWMYLRRTEPHIEVRRNLLAPEFLLWRRIFAIGLPAGAEFSLMFFSTAVVYLAIRDQGASAQAGFGIGSRILQAILLPGLAVAVAAGPIAGQSFGAGNTARVREVFRTAAVIGGIVMLITTAIVQWQPTTLIRMFDADPSATSTAILFLQLMSWTFVAQGLVYTCAYMFQGLGNTVPALVSASVRFVAFAIPTMWLSQQSGFQMNQIWYLLTGSVAMQALLSLWLLNVEFKRRLRGA